MSDPGSGVSVARCRGPRLSHSRPHARHSRARLAPAAAPVLIAAALATAYLVVAPMSADLAAQTYRAGLFDRAGWLLWDNAWYGGHPLPGYSVLFPPLGALLGVRVVGAVSAVAAAALFGALVRGAFPARRAAIGAAWFAAAIAAQLLTGRLTFLLGVAFGLAALFAARRSGWIGVLLAALTTLASPVAGAFVALAGVAWAVAGRRGAGAALAAGAVVPGVAVTVLFSEGGVEPFVPSSFWPAFAALALIAALLPREQHVLRAGAALAAAGCLLAFAVPTPLGGNAARLGALFAGPLLACVPLAGRRRTIVLAAVPLLAYWQLMPPVRDAVVGAGDPSTQASYYAPLAAELARRPLGRVEVPFTRNHWEARYLAERVPLARGWERQLDRERNALFYDGRLTAARLRRWLDVNAVRWIALPDVALDRSARTEAALVRGGTVPGVREVWRDRHWRLFAVAGAPPLAQGAAGLVVLGPDSFTLDARRTGMALVRVRWSPYWALTAGAGCVRRAPGGWTEVRAARPGRLHVAQRFALWRGLRRAEGDRCARHASPSRRRTSSACARSDRPARVSSPCSPGPALSRRARSRTAGRTSSARSRCSPPPTTATASSAGPSTGAPPRPLRTRGT